MTSGGGGRFDSLYTGKNKNLDFEFGKNTQVIKITQYQSSISIHVCNFSFYYNNTCNPCVDMKYFVDPDPQVDLSAMRISLP